MSFQAQQQLKTASAVTFPLAFASPSTLRISHCFILQHCKLPAHGAGTHELVGNRASPRPEKLIHVGPVWSFGPMQDSLIFHKWLIWCNGFQMQYLWVSLLSTCRNSLYFCPGVLAKLEVGIKCCSFSRCTFPRTAVKCCMKRLFHEKLLLLLLP